MSGPIFQNEECVYSGPYLHFHIKTFAYKNRTIQWETLSRPPHGSNPHGSDAIATIRKPDGDYIILIYEHRIPIDSYVLSFPGGGADTMSPINDALRELKEETGYTARAEQVTHLSPRVYIDPWKSTENLMYVCVRVDPENSETTQDLGDCEVIEVVLAKKQELLSEIMRLSSEKQCEIDSRLYSYALGLQFSSILN